MEELALKPLNPIDASYSNQVVDSVVRSELVYRYGEDISKWAVPQPFTLNHTQTAGSLLSMFDNDLTSYYELSQVGAADGSYTTTIILDFQRLLAIRGVILGGNLNVNGPVALHTCQLEYSIDNENWTSLGTKQGTSAGDNFFDIVSNIQQIRSLRMKYTTGGGAGATYHGRFYQFMIIV